jgi:predicted N-acetyltransferase YhbS
MLLILPERPADGAAIGHLLDHAFGANRHERTVYKLRPGAPIPQLALVAIEDGALVGSLRFWPVRLDRGAGGVLLGPLAVEPALRGRGIGKTLVRHGLEAAKRCGHGLCLVSGDPDYYAPFGFVAAEPLGLTLPGPVSPGHFQVKELSPGWLALARGEVKPAAAGTERAA